MNTTSIIYLSILHKHIHIKSWKDFFQKWQLYSRTNSNIKSWMVFHGIASGTALAQYFEDNLFSVIKSLNKTIVVWEDLFDNKIQLDAHKIIIQVWQSVMDIKPVWKQRAEGDGRETDVITIYPDRRSRVSHSSRPVGISTNKYQSQIILTTNFLTLGLTSVNNDPTSNLGLTSPQEALVLGSEVTMWGWTSRWWLHGYRNMATCRSRGWEALELTWCGRCVQC